MYFTFPLISFALALLFAEIRADFQQMQAVRITMDGKNYLIRSGRTL